MTIDEIFPNPTVKQVLFQIRFPNLFYMENKIGEFQMKIIKEFPESSLLFRRQIVFADVGAEGQLEKLPSDLDQESGKKIWQFRSEKGAKLNVQTDSLAITSEYHKTYNLGTEDKFRDTIRFVVDNFLEFSAIPIINRIGLRYIDECPIPNKTNDAFKDYYNSVFPLDRFNLDHADEMDFKTLVRREEYYLRYIESLKKRKDVYILILDFDGFANKIPSEVYLNVLDDLHTLISEEYQKTIKEPVYQYMRERREG